MTIREHAERLLQQVLTNPFAAVYAGMGVLGTVWGTVVIYEEILQRVPARWAIPAHAALFLLLACPAAGWWLTSYRRRYGIGTTTDYFFPSIENTWEIDATGSACMTTAKTYYFLRAPEPEDLTDSAFGSAPLTLAQLNYDSPDATASDYKAVNARRHLIYWTPQNGIAAGVPYVHTVKARYPYAGPLPAFKSLTFAPHARTLRVTVRVRSEIAIKEAIAYQGFRFQQNRKADAIARKARVIPHRRAPLPVRRSANEVEWTIENVAAGTTYYLVLFFEGTPPVETSPAALSASA